MYDGTHYHNEYDSNGNCSKNEWTFVDEQGRTIENENELVLRTDYENDENGNHINQKTINITPEK